MSTQAKTTRLRARSYSHNSDENWNQHSNDRRSRFGSTINTNLNPRHISEEPINSPTVTTNIVNSVDNV